MPQTTPPDDPRDLLGSTYLMYVQLARRMHHGEAASYGAVNLTDLEMVDRSWRFMAGWETYLAGDDTEPFPEWAAVHPGATVPALREDAPSYITGTALFLLGQITALAERLANELTDRPFRCPLHNDPAHLICDRCVQDWA